MIANLISGIAGAIGFRFSAQGQRYADAKAARREAEHNWARLNPPQQAVGKYVPPTDAGGGFGFWAAMAAGAIPVLIVIAHALSR